MEGNIKVKVQSNTMIAIHQEGSTVTIHSLKMPEFLPDLGLAKRWATQLKPGKIRIDELSSEPEKLFTEALLEDLSKAMAEEINAALENECITCYEPAVQIHSGYLSDPREKVGHNVDDAFWIVDCLSNETAFEKTKDKIQVTAKDKDLYLTRSELLRNVFFIDRLKVGAMKLIL